MWANAIYAAGFTQWGNPGTNCDPTTLAQGLANLEATDAWPFGDFAVEAPGFLQACKAALVHGADDQVDFNAVVLLCARLLFSLLNIPGKFSP